MKVSVIIPAYNEEKYIRKCLNSLKKQQEKPDEIILIDNNCSDNTVNIANQFNITVVKEKKQGMIAARNRGFNEAKYEIIARIDADTVVPKDWIKIIKQNFQDNQIDALTGPVTPYDLTFPSPSYAQLYFFIMKTIQDGKETLVGPNMAITKNIWQKVKSKICLNDNKVHEDIDLAIHINQIGGIIKKDSRLIVGSSSRRMKNNPISFFVEYPVRAIRTIMLHKKI